MKPLFICFIVLLAFGCVKDGIDSNDAFKGNSHITGQVRYVDKYSGRSEQKLFANRRVYISNTPTDGIAFNYFVKTDAQGYFTFENLNDVTHYDLFVTDSIDKVMYSAVRTVQTPNDTVLIIAENDVSKQNGILLQVADANGQPAGLATVYLYNNEQIFHQDTAGTQSIAKLTTDAYGRALFYNVKDGNYFARGRGIYGGKTIEGETSLTFDGKGITTFPLKLVVPVTSVLIKTVDAANGIFPNVSFCVFNNLQFFNANTCNGSIHSYSTGADGTKTLAGLDTGTYYFLAQDTIQNVLYKGTGTVKIDGTPAKTITITLLKATTSINITVNDQSGFAVNGTDLYLFASKDIFLADTGTTTAGYLKKLTANDAGQASFQDISAGTYFIRAKAVYGTLFLRGGDTASVSSGVNLSHTIVVRPK